MVGVSGELKFGFRCDRQVPHPALAGRAGSLPAGRQEGAQYRRQPPYREAPPFKAWSFIPANSLLLAPAGSARWTKEEGKKRGRR